MKRVPAVTLFRAVSDNFVIEKLALFIRYLNVLVILVIFHIVKCVKI